MISGYLLTYNNEDTFQILTPLNVKANNLNNIIKNNWLKANINFDLKILDD